MDIILYSCIGLVVGFVIAFLLSKAKTKGVEALLEKCREELLTAQNEIKRLQEINTSNQVDIASKSTMIENQLTTIGELKQQAVALKEELSDISADRSELYAKSETVTKELDLLRKQKEKDDEERQKQFSEQLEMVQEQLKTTTEKLLKSRAEELSSTNSTQMNAIINPLKETIKEMKEAMHSNRDTSNKNTASLEKAIEEVLKRANDVGSEADKLARALRSENKIQGNWGEIILEELLKSQGLEEGKHYDTQETLKDANGKALKHDETGKRMIPDVIMHYPDKKDAIIDAKVSLSAFIDYQNAENEEERSNALTRHIISVKSHIDELAKKDYSRYIIAPRQSINYVIMFVPNESALQLALYNEPMLWRDAFAKGVFITSEQNLTAALRIIKMAWTHMAQTKNQEEVFRLADMLVKRVGEFYDYFKTIGDKIEAVHTAYEKADKKLIAGKQNMIAPAKRLIELGAKEDAQRALPETIETDLFDQ